MRFQQKKLCHWRQKVEQKALGPDEEVGTLEIGKKSRYIAYRNVLSEYVSLCMMRTLVYSHNASNVQEMDHGERVVIIRSRT